MMKTKIKILINLWKYRLGIQRNSVDELIEDYLLKSK